MKVDQAVEEEVDFKDGVGIVEGKPFLGGGGLFDHVFVEAVAIGFCA